MTGTETGKLGPGGQLITGVVLFVEDELKLAEQQESLASALPGWHLLFATTGAQGKQRLEGREVDVVVADLRLPDMSGIDVLADVQRNQPGTARLMIAEQDDPKILIAAAQVAQHVVPKPVDLQALTLAVRRVMAVRRTLEAPALRDLMGSIDRLPALPDVYQRIVDAVNTPNCQVKDVAGIVASDIATSAELLRLVNSALYSLPRQVVSVEEAITLLGMESVTSLVLAGSMFRSGSLPGGLDGEELRKLATRSCEVARAVARSDGWSPHQAGQVALAAMLRDAGLLALAPGHPDAVAHLDRSLTDPLARAEQERAAFGCTVPAASAYLLGLWNFPPVLVHAVAGQPLSEDEPGSSVFEQILGYAYHRVIAGPDVLPQAPLLDPHRRVRWSTSAEAVLAPAEAVSRATTDAPVVPRPAP
jgi:HD-like signal output (HDOD) protein/CheY-like chemotaxis protein